MAKKSKTPPVKAAGKPSSPEENMMKIRNQVAEFFDHAIILVSQEVEGNTEFYHTTIGNQFAVKGMLDAFVKETEEESCGFEEDLEDEECEDN
jgi:hypothetical protein